MKTVAKTPKKKQSRAVANPNAVHYVRNAELLPEVIRAKQLGVITSELSSMIEKIAIRYSYKSNFASYSFREDMASAAVMNLIHNANALKFDHERYSNPFAFYTTAIHRSFLQYIADEKKHRDIRDTLLTEAGLNASFSFMEAEQTPSDEQHHTEDDITSDNLIEPKAPAEGEEEEEEEHSLNEFRRKHRAHSDVTVYGPGDFTTGPNGELVFLTKGTVVSANG